MKDLRLFCWTISDTIPFISAVECTRVWSNNELIVQVFLVCTIAALLVVLIRNRLRRANTIVPQPPRDLSPASLDSISSDRDLKLHYFPALDEEIKSLRSELNEAQAANSLHNHTAIKAAKTIFLLNDNIRRLRLQLIMAPTGKTYSEDFVVALIASFMARDGKVTIDTKGLSAFAHQLGEEITPAAAEHRTRPLKKKAQDLVAQSAGTPLTTPSATPRKRAAPSMSARISNFSPL